MQFYTSLLRVVQHRVGETEFVNLYRFFRVLDTLKFYFCQFVVNCGGIMNVEEQQPVFNINVTARFQIRAHQVNHYVRLVFDALFRNY